MPLADRLIDATARRPSGWIARKTYGGPLEAPKGHETVFDEVLDTTGPLPSPSLRNWWVWVWGSRMHVYDDESMRSMLDTTGFAEVAITRSYRSAEPLQLVRTVRR
jgi:hypothetical protein